MSHIHPNPERRKRHLSAIHAAKHALAMENDVYRDMLERISTLHGTPVRSAAQLSAVQIDAVLNELRRLGGLKPGQRAAGKPRNFDNKAMPEMIRKVEALLADMKLSWSYADAIVERQFGIKRVAWCRREDQLRSLIAALHVEQEKRELLAEIESRCARAGLSMSQFEERFGLSGVRGWKRNRTSLKSLLEAMSTDEWAAR